MVGLERDGEHEREWETETSLSWSSRLYDCSSAKLPHSSYIVAEGRPALANCSCSSATLSQSSNLNRPGLLEMVRRCIEEDRVEKCAGWLDLSSHWRGELADDCISAQVCPLLRLTLQLLSSTRHCILLSLSLIDLLHLCTLAKPKHSSQVLELFHRGGTSLYASDVCRSRASCVKTSYFIMGAGVCSASTSCIAPGQCEWRMREQGRQCCKSNQITENERKGEKSAKRLWIYENCRSREWDTCTMGNQQKDFFF